LKCLVGKSAIVVVGIVQSTIDAEAIVEYWFE